MNTGIQRSSSTPVGAWTTTTPVGTTKYWKAEPKKNMVEIMAAHKIPYTATASIGLEIEGPKYYQIFSPCPTGWRSPPEKTVEIARLATKSCAFPIYEIEDGRYTVNKKPKKIQIKQYFMEQGRFRHLPENIVNEIQNNVDQEWELLLKKEEFTQNL